MPIYNLDNYSLNVLDPIKQFNIKIKSHETIKYTWDWDDISYKGIIIKISANYYTFNISNDKSRPKGLFNISDINKLNKAPDWLVDCFNGNKVQIVSNIR